MRPELTILTDPVPYGRFLLTEAGKALGRPVKRMLSPVPAFTNSPYRGHPAVTRSLVEGLRKIDADFNCNPKRLKDVGETVVVLSSIGAVRQAIGWKRRGKISKVLAGPNILVWPSEHPEIGAWEIDVCIVNSEWTQQAFEEDLPSLRGRCVVWPAGVDTERWKPPTAFQGERRGVIVFDKYYFEGSALLREYEHRLREAGFDDRNTFFIVRGQKRGYTPDEYYDKLAHSSLLIGFSRSESQGIAWAEAWSMDVPTFILRNEWNVICGKETRVSTAPYLTAETGMFFDDLNHFSIVLSEWARNRGDLHPRAWVMENMSDEVCAKKMLEIVRGVPVGCP